MNAVSNQDLKLRIIDAAMQEFNIKGVKFTMDSIAKKLEISKKTIYKLFPDKENLLMCGVERGFELVKQSENMIVNNKDYDIVEKLSRILIVLPDNFSTIDFRKLSTIKEVYPKVFDEIILKINTGWEQTIEIYEEAVRQKRIRNISFPIFRLMVEASIKSFISDKELVNKNITYEEALKSMVDILMKGMIA